MYRMTGYAIRQAMSAHVKGVDLCFTTRRDTAGECVQLSAVSCGAMDQNDRPCAIAATHVMSEGEPTAPGDRDGSWGGKG